MEGAFFMAAISLFMLSFIKEKLINIKYVCGARFV
jgi:hypothetical protein